MRSSLFWDVTQGRLVVSYRRFRTAIGPTFKGEAGSLKVEPIGCPDTSAATNLPCVTSQKTEDLVKTTTFLDNTAM
jgi:hypothetical protein